MNSAFSDNSIGAGCLSLLTITSETFKDFQEYVSKKKRKENGNGKKHQLLRDRLLGMSILSQRMRRMSGPKGKSVLAAICGGGSLPDLSMLC